MKQRLSEDQQVPSDNLLASFPRRRTKRHMWMNNLVEPKYFKLSATAVNVT